MSNPVAEGLSENAQRDRSRQIFTYTLPEHMAKAHGIETIGLVELTASEETNAAKRAGTNPMRLGSEQAKEALRMVDGKRVNTFDGSADKAWNLMHPKVRNLVIVAFGKLHQPEQAEAVHFLESMTTTVG